jgi:putative addiction module component (TIGR02574 family)
MKRTYEILGRCQRRFFALELPWFAPCKATLPFKLAASENDEKSFPLATRHLATLNWRKYERAPDRDAFHQLRDRPLYGTLIDMIKETIPELQKLSTADKFALAVELWDELSSNPDEMPVTEEQLSELDRRFEEYRQDPNKVVTWEEAKARILSGRR